MANKPLTAFRQYKRLAKELLDGRAAGTLAEAQDDTLLEQMDVLWPQMSARERAEIDMNRQRTIWASAAQEYRSGVYNLLLARKAGTLTEEQEEARVDRLVDLWWEMTDEEQAEERQRRPENTISLYERFLACLARHDLVRLICMGAPKHEYRPETPVLIDWFTEHPATTDLDQVTTAVRDIFVKMFGASVAHEEAEHYREAAQELLSIWQKWQEEQVK